jgi:antitoxin HicB
MKAKRAEPVKRKAKAGARVAAFLDDDGLLEDAEAAAIKRVLAWQLEKSMKAQGVSKQLMAKRMCTSRSQLDRLLNPEVATVQLDTVARAAKALGKRLEVKLVG